MCATSITLTFIKSASGVSLSKGRCRSLHGGDKVSDPTPPLRMPLRLPPKPLGIRIIKSHKTQTTNTTATDILRLMDALQLSVPPHIYDSLLKECIDSRDAVRGAEVHVHINRSGRPPGLHLANRLLLMYARCGHLKSARKLFDKMSVKDSVSWTTMIAGHVDNGYHKEALTVLTQMRQSGVLEVLADDFILQMLILGCTLKACIRASKFGLAMGKQLHGWLLKMGRTNSASASAACSEDLLLGSLLIDFYGKFGCLECAQRVFDQMHHRDTVVWTAMIAVYCRREHFDKVLDVFKEMGRAGKMKNKFTFSSALRACGRMGDGGRCGQQVHANAIKCGVESAVFVQTSLVDMYGRCGLVGDARRAFEIVCDNRNGVCWNAMLNVFTFNSFYKEAIQLLYRMKAVGLTPLESMVNQVRMACGG